MAWRLLRPPEGRRESARELKERGPAGTIKSSCTTTKQPRTVRRGLWTHVLVNPGLSSRGRRACGGAWACATVVERRRRLQVRRASTASSGSLHAEVTRYRYTVRWRIAWSISYATRFPPRSRVPWYVRGSRTTVSKENSSSAGEACAWPRGRRVQRQNAERAVAPGARARCGPTPFGVACGRKARPALRVMGRYRDRAGESAKWNGAIAWIPRIRMLSAGRLRGPGGPGALYFCGRAAPARGAHPDRGPPPAKTSNCRAGLPAWCLSPRGSRCSCSDRPLSRLGDWDTDSRDQARPAAADTLRRPTCTRHRLKRGKW